MKIAMVAPIDERVPPQKYGGIERVVYNLTEALVELGHDVTLFATADSETSAKLIPIFDTPTRLLPEAQEPGMREAYTNIALERLLHELDNNNYDIVHNHLGWGLLTFRSFIETPIVTTLHLSLRRNPDMTMFDLYNGQPLISISNSQRMAAPNLNYIATVYNGIQVEKFDFNDKPKDYLAFLGSIIPHKGPDIAIDIAERSGKRLKIAAKIDPLQQDYFDNEIAPHIDGRQIEFLGEVGHDEKNELLRSAAALLMPIQWSEPFGLVMAEAMACGTPVIALDLGSVPEVVVSQETGFICNTPDEMIEAIDKIPEINRRDCRLRVEDSFSATRMAEDYLEAYKTVLSD